MIYEHGGVDGDTRHRSHRNTVSQKHIAQEGELVRACLGLQCEYSMEPVQFRPVFTDLKGGL